MSELIFFAGIGFFVVVVFGLVVWVERRASRRAYEHSREQAERHQEEWREAQRRLEASYKAQQRPEPYSSEADALYLARLQKRREMMRPSSPNLRAEEMLQNARTADAERFRIQGQSTNPLDFSTWLALHGLVAPPAGGLLLDTTPQTPSEGPAEAPCPVDTTPPCGSVE